MKTSNLKKMICILFLFVCKISDSQSLSISGKFIDKELMYVTANYTLMCNGIMQVTGRGDEMEATLELNKEYALIVGSKSTENQTIIFSTNTNTLANFSFDFEMILKSIEVDKVNSEKKIFVYFNPKKNIFEYNRIKVSKN